MNNKYDSISPCDKSICTFFNEVDDIVRDAGLKTRIRAGSEDNILEIVDGDTMIGMVDGLSAGISHPGNEEMMFFQPLIEAVRLRIPFVSHPENEAVRLRLLQEAMTREQPHMTM